MKNIMTIAIALCLAATAQAAEVDLKKSTVQWTGSKITGSFHTGKVFPKTLEVEAPKGVIESAKIVMDLATFTVTDLTGKTGEKFLRHMKSADFFDVEKFPTATLKVNAIKDGVARGELTIKDKTNPVQFKVQQQDTTYTGQLKFDRTKFGMIYGSGSFFKNLGDKVISDEVVVDFKIVLNTEAQKASL